MSYIDKNGNIVISARMTDVGRSKLSLGQLNFNTFKLGDSEVDYNTLGGPSTNDITLQNIFRAKATQPKAKTWLLPTTNNLTGAVGIGNLTELEIGTIIDAPEIGFFSTGNTSGTTIVTSFSAQTIDTYTLNEAVINVSDLSGGTTVSIGTGSTTTSTYEPAIGDLMMVKYSNPDLTDPQTPGEVELNTPVPYLWYKVQTTAGSLSANTLQVTVDRDLPDFSAYAGANVSTVIFYPGNTTTNGISSEFTTGIYSGGTIWNMNNVWSNNMAGVGSGYEQFTSYGSEAFVGTKEFFGYTSQLSGSCEQNKAISIIHYTNTDTCDRQSEVTYGQKLHVELDLGETPVLKMPTLMWHRNLVGTSIGQTFSGTGVQKYVKQGTINTDIRYFDLADENSNTVGRIFPDQHVFTIDDDELVAALSYKSNRNWTLPKITAGLQTAAGDEGLLSNVYDLHVTYMFNNTSSGFTAGLHSQYHTCRSLQGVDESGDDLCPDGTTKDVTISFPAGQLRYMSATGSTGWSANEFKIIAQKVPLTVLGEHQLPDPTLWKIMDFTTELQTQTSHVVGDKIDPLNLEAGSFVINQTIYDAGTTYDLHDYINIPTTSETSTLQFGDETFFYGNVCAAGITNKYRTKFNFTIPPNQYLTTNNPTWAGSGQNTHISEVIIQDTSGNVVAVGKENLPIDKNDQTTIIIEIAFDM